jgi:DNA polymerase phi
MTGQEERDMLFARLFGLSSVIQSGLLVRDDPLPSSSTVGSSLSSYNRVIGCLLELGEKKSWLRESAWWTISLAVDVLSGSDVAWKDEALNATVDALFKDNTSWTPEKIALVLKLQNIRPELEWNAILSPTFKHPGLLDTRNLGILAKILKVPSFVFISMILTQLKRFDFCLFVYSGILFG